MGGKGRPRQPTALLAFKGSHRAVSRAKTEPKPETLTDLKPPRECPTYARKYWNLLAPQLHAIGVLSTLDPSALILVCEAWADSAHAAKKARNPREPQSFKWLAVRDRKWMQVLTGLKEFGCTPASRSRVEVLVPGLGHQKPADIAAALPAKPVAGAGFGAERERRAAAAAQLQPEVKPIDPPTSE